ncbi:hypothetical protein WR25_20276 [Diploscapter pachys]|uniref:Uncharacterized protein n=1 Tax=Diploscapter pachys TaxID=2018661 RepID=A0A2A2LP57_9BILA|nr:hypothetical protein WR25_20276 [Diploscapter pachys]
MDLLSLTTQKSSVLTTIGTYSTEYNIRISVLDKFQHRFNLNFNLNFNFNFNDDATDDYNRRTLRWLHDRLGGLPWFCDVQFTNTL